MGMADARMAVEPTVRMLIALHRRAWRSLHCTIDRDHSRSITIDHDRSCSITIHLRCPHWLSTPPCFTNKNAWSPTKSAPRHLICTRSLTGASSLLRGARSTRFRGAARCFLRRLLRREPSRGLMRNERSAYEARGARAFWRNAVGIK